MKLSKKLAEVVADSEMKNRGTTFYRVTLEQLKDVFSESNDSNLWLVYAIIEYGFNAINIDDIWGSAIVGDDLYLCKTNGEYITVGENNEVEPESALESYGISELLSYVVQDTPAEVIKKMITDYEFNFHDVDDLAIKMIEDGHSFIQIARDAKEIDILDEE